MSSEPGFIALDAADVHVAQAGTGPVLLFLHHCSGSTRTWAPVVEQLADANRLRRHGFPRLGRVGQGSVEPCAGTLADDVLAVVDRLGLTDHAIVGPSMGGKVAQLVAARGDAASLRDARGRRAGAHGPVGAAADETDRARADRRLQRPQPVHMAAATGHLPGFAENRVASVSREDVAACAGALATEGHRA